MNLSPSLSLSMYFISTSVVGQNIHSRLMNVVFLDGAYSEYYDLNSLFMEHIVHG